MLEPGWYRFTKASRAHFLGKPDAHDPRQYHAACGLQFRDAYVVRDSSLEKCSECVRELNTAGERLCQGCVSGISHVCVDGSFVGMFKESVHG